MRSPDEPGAEWDRRTKEKLLLKRMKENSENESFISELYEKMCATPDLCGSFERVRATIVWSLCKGYVVTIGRDRVDISRTFGRYFSYPLTHWHPTDDELFEDICRLGKRGNVTVIHDTLWCAIVYSGPARDCKYHRK